MQKLLALTRKLPVFFSAKWLDKKILLQAFLLAGIARIIILSIPFKKYQKYLGAYNQETSYEIDINDYKTIKKIGWAVNIVSLYTPWESKCLVQAIIAQRMLKRRKVSSTLYLGVNKNKNNNMQAHAWLRCGQVFVTGGYNKNEFIVVAKFAKNFL